MRNHCVDQSALALLLHAVLAPGVGAQLQPEDVLLVWNSACVDSQMVRDAYVAARPGIREFDYADPALVVPSCSLAEGFDPGDKTFTIDGFDYQQFDELARGPLAAWFSGEDCEECTECADDCAERQAWITDGIGAFSTVNGPKVIVTTRGLPARIAGQEQTGTLEATMASFESELACFLFDLRQNNPAVPGLDEGSIFNPYIQLPGAVVDATRILPDTLSTTVVIQNTSPPVNVRAIVLPVSGANLVPALFPVTRLDASPLPDVAPLDATLAMIERSRTLGVLPCTVRNVIDEWPGAGLSGPDFKGFTDDYDDTAAVLRTLPAPFDFVEGTLESDLDAIDTIFDESLEFVSAAEAAADGRSTFILATFGVNHSNTLAGAPAGAEPADTDDDPSTPSLPNNFLRGFDTVHPAGLYNSYESFSGNSLINGGGRGNQQQGGEWIALGGSFALLHVAEPLTTFVANVNDIVSAMLGEGRSWGEGAAASLLAFSWQNTPLGDPLATIGAHNLDVNGDGAIDAEDAYAQATNPIEQNCDGSLDETDDAIVFEALRQDELDDLFAAPSARD
ncbi:MAG: hypothetical protein AAGI30_02760 [Planctomycetota bacterium]